MKLSLSDIQAFPKAELHRHIDGSVPRDVVLRLARKNGIREFELRTGERVLLDDESAFDDFYQIHTTNGINDFLSRFDMVLSVMQAPEDIEEVFYAATCDVAKKNIWYVEWTMAPGYHTREGLSYAEVIESALRGMQRGYDDTGVYAKLICAIHREACDKKKPEDKRDPSGTRLARTAARYGDRGVAALGLACNEAAYPPELYAGAFRVAEDAGLCRVPHAGEMGERRAHNVRVAVEELHAQRIGHGIPVGKSGELQQLLRRSCVTVEANPLSNLMLGFINSLEELRLDAVYESEVALTINSDDPILLEKELADNFYAVWQLYEWGEEELHTCIRNALRAGCMNDDEQKERGAFFAQKGLSLL